MSLTPLLSYLANTAFRLIGMIFLLGSSWAIAAAPGGVSQDLVVWLDAAKGVKKAGQLARPGDSIDLWRDQSRRRRHDATNAGQQGPLLQAADSADFNHHPALRFNSAQRKLTFGNDYVFSAGSGAPHGMTWFSVVKPQIPKDLEGPFVYDIGSWGNSGYGVFYSAKKLGVHAQANGTSQASSFVMHTRGQQTTLIRHQIEFARRVMGFLDGETLPSVSSPIRTQALNAQTLSVGNPSSGGRGPFTIGRVSKNHAFHRRYFPGDIAEIIGFDRVLSTAESQRVESYLALKYGITLGQTGADGGANIGIGDYVASDLTTNYFSAPADRAGAYHHNIFGLGRDDAAGVHQKISSSASPHTVLSASLDGWFERPNTGISKSFSTDKQFVMFANNRGRAINAKSTHQLPKFGGYDQRTDRQWQVQRTGYNGAFYLRFLGFDDSWVLLADKDGDFSLGARQIGVLNHQGVIHANNSHLPDKMYFTLARKDPSLATADKLLIEHDGQGIYYCDESIVFKAMRNDGTLASSYSGTIQISTDSRKGQWRLGTYAKGRLLSTNTGDGSALYQFDSRDKGLVRLTLVHPHGASRVNINATDSIIHDDDSHGPLQWGPQGFSVDSLHAENFDQVRAGEPQMLVLKALNSDVRNKQCVTDTQFHGAINVALSREQLNPATPQLPVFVSPQWVPIPLPMRNNTFLNVPVQFYKGRGVIPWRYDDVGQMRLRVRDPRNPQRQGSSPIFVSRPYRIQLTAENPGFSRLGNDRFAVAGEDFTVRIKSLNSAAGLTPSFGKESPPVGVRIAPIFVTGDEAGVLTSGFVLRSGAFESTQTQYSEVGHIGLRAEVHWNGVSNSYLGTRLDHVSHMNSTFSIGDIGRFIPERFVLLQAEQGQWQAGCSGKSYLGDTQYLGNDTWLKIAAINRQGDKTRNYQFGHISYHTDFMLAGQDASTQLADGSALALQDSKINALAQNARSGEITLRLKAEYRHKMRPGHVQDIAPFEADVPLWLNNFFDGDNVRLPQAVHLHPRGNRIYRARVRLPSGIAVRTEPYFLKSFFEVFDGQQFVTDVSGGCAQIEKLNISPMAWRPLPFPLARWSTSIHPLPSSQRAFLSSSLGVLTYTLPSLSQSMGEGRLSIHAEVPSYLQYAWQTDAVLRNPEAVIDYGSGKTAGELANGRIIFVREMF